MLSWNVNTQNYRCRCLNNCCSVHEVFMCRTINLDCSGRIRSHLTDCSEETNSHYV